MNRGLFSFMTIVVLAVVFVVGVVFGMMIQVQKDAPQIGKAAETMKVLASRVVPSVVIYGQISKIDENLVTVSFNGDTATVKLRNGAAISSFNGQVGGTPQAVSLSDVQVGQTASISAKVLTDGTLQGETLIILPNR